MAELLGFKGDTTKSILSAFKNGTSILQKERFKPAVAALRKLNKNIAGRCHGIRLLYEDDFTRIQELFDEQREKAGSGPTPFVDESTASFATRAMFEKIALLGRRSRRAA